MTIMSLSVHLLYLCVAACFTNAIPNAKWILTFNDSNNIEMEMDNSITIIFHAQTNASWKNEQIRILVINSDDVVAYTSKKFFDLPINNQLPINWTFSFNLTSEFIGYTKLTLEVVGIENNTIIAVKSPNNVHKKIKVIRKPQLIDTFFIISVAFLMSVIFINLGCALDVEQLKQCIRTPIAPAASFFTQFIMLPIVSFFFAKLIFPNSVSMQLGLFFTGISPGGGASSVWSLLLGGNINLSVVLTTIGTLESFIMIPFWTLFLGKFIFSMGEMPVPYSRISSSIVALIIPLCIGYCIQRYFPSVNKLMIRILKPLASCLIIFIIIFATVTNLYLFKIFTWEIIVAGAMIPWTGYLIGFLASLLIRLSEPDIISMTIESGIQNTGIAIFMLKFSLGQPEADITTVIPVAVALMTPLPLLICFTIKKYFEGKNKISETQDLTIGSMLRNKENEIKLLDEESRTEQS